MSNLNLPAPFLARMKSQLPEEFPDFLASYRLPRTNGLRLNTLKLDRVRFLSDFLVLPGASSFSLRPVPWAREGYYYDYRVQAGQHPWHSAGLYYLQEPSAMAVVAYLDPRPGEKILDLAAAPGGKSTQIAARLQGEGLLWANEIHPARARILAANLERWGSPNVIISQETPERLSPRLARFFDRILLDAPCSGEGMFRKDPDAVRAWSPDNVSACAKRQAFILDHASAMLTAGGRLVYSTCTFSREENEEIVLAFLAKHPDFRPLPLPPLDPRFVACPDLPGAFRLYPHRIEGEGHFIAVLERSGSDSGQTAGAGTTSAGKIFSGEAAERPPLKKTSGRASSRKPPHPAVEPFLAFARETLTIPWPAESPRYLCFGERLYFAPWPGLPLDGLSIVRPGLHLGTIKPGRFQPGQGLAQSLTTDQAQHFIRLRPDDPALKLYLQGESWPDAGPDGWLLVCLDRFPLGWAKRSQDQLKNHYPKELRQR